MVLGQRLEPHVSALENGGRVRALHARSLRAGAATTEP